MNLAEKKQDKTLSDWAGLVQQAKEKLVKTLWGLTGVSEGEKELVVKEYLWEMEKLQEKVQEAVSRWDNDQRLFRDENELLRSLLGANDHELKGRILALGQEIHDLRRDLISARDEAGGLRQRAGELAESNENLRRALKETQDELEAQRVQEAQRWQTRLAEFHEQQAQVREQVSRVNEDMGRVRDLLSTQAEEMTREKQAELAALQARLMGEMEKSLRTREDLLWAEEEIFAQGVAQKLRGELQAATGRLQLTLERFRLLDRSGPAARTWETWWRLLRGGPAELSRGFQEVAADLQKAVQTLEEYLALTHRRPPSQEEVNLPELIRRTAGRLQGGRMDKGALEVLAPEVLPLIKGDAELLEVVLRTLLDNAFEALPRSGGRVRIQAEESPEKREVWVSVSDSGGGVPESQRDRLFQPFFTTKTGHRGLGLARARRYAEWHRGRLELIESGPDGSVFRLALPL